jgi:hypothetical protein
VVDGGGRFHPIDDIEVGLHLKSVLAALDLPTSKVTIEVADGVVRLRGEVREPVHAGWVVDAIRREPGVRQVESWLHLPGEAPQNKRTALEASARAAERG